MPTTIEEDEMIEITDLARSKLLESVKDHGESPAVRVYIAGAG